MIPASPRPLLGGLVRLAMRRRLRQGLAGIRVLGLARTRALARERPLILAGNHVAFWDGFLCERISDLLGVEPRALMLAAQLRAVPMLRWIGAFAAEEGDARDGARALLHAGRFLDRPGRALWIFPQGHQRPQWERPLGFRGGAALLARRAPRAALVPFALHYELGEHERPEAWVQLGAPLEDPGALEAAVESGLAGLRSAILEGKEAVRLLHPPARLGDGPATRLFVRARSLLRGGR